MADLLCLEANAFPFPVPTGLPQEKTVAYSLASHEAWHYKLEHSPRLLFHTNQ